LYGLVPTSNISKLILYSPNQKYEYDVKIPGINATDTIANMEENWKEIAESKHVTTVKMITVPQMEVLKRCRWVNAHTLKIRSLNGLDENDEWFNCLAKSCPNIKKLVTYDQKITVGQKEVLYDNNLWPDLVQMANPILTEIIHDIEKVRPRLQCTVNGFYETPWEGQWLQRRSHKI
jgi:hypothetical protein